MAEIKRTARTTWTGDVHEGGGEVDLATSGAASGLGISLPTRASEESQGQTSPEELIAAAHAGCYAMALSLTLTQDGNAPESLDVSSEVTLSRTQDGLSISRSELSVRGRVPGLDASDFEQAARRAEELCPVSNALRGNVEITLGAELEGS